MQRGWQRVMMRCPTPPHHESTDQGGIRAFDLRSVPDPLGGGDAPYSDIDCTASTNAVTSAARIAGVSALALNSQAPSGAAQLAK